jgi:hypothetical protein|tara:strand:+ start:148 stop:297 length:150 start_codon:yes stop_codon:yes gene_type:complete
MDIGDGNDIGVIFTLSGKFSYSEAENSLIELFKSQNFRIYNIGDKVLLV